MNVAIGLLYNKEVDNIGEVLELIHTRFMNIGIDFVIIPKELAWYSINAEIFSGSCDSIIEIINKLYYSTTCDVMIVYDAKADINIITDKEILESITIPIIMDGIIIFSREKYSSWFHPFQKDKFIISSTHLAPE